MKRSFFKLFTLSMVFGLYSLVALAQVPTSTLSGSVLDPSGAVVAGATITVRNVGTGAESKTTTSTNGTFAVPQLPVGLYTVTISAKGFKQVVVQDVKIDAATAASLNQTLEVGQQSESVVVQGGADVLQTQSANISTTIVGRQITELPFTSRDALDLVLLLPGTSTPGRPRTSTVNGLPKGAINISMDGVNVQDNTLKSSDGFFTYIRPRIDAVDEVTVSTATPGAESAGEGAVQIKFVTRSGNNEFHGSVYEYHRNPSLNANYWFNNRDLAPDPRTGKAPRARLLLNQYGGRVGGPIIKDRAFFFVNYEEYRLPEQVTRMRTILSPQAQAGVFRYNSGGTVRSTNLLTLIQPAGCTGCTNTLDPTTSKLLADIAKSTTTTGSIQALTDPNLQRFTVTNTGGQDRYFPTVRLDFNLTSKHHLENIWNYNKFGSKVDFLNSRDPQFPGFPNFGSQISNRFSNVTALRSTFTPTLVNEVRFGLTGGTVLFFPEPSVADFTGPVANQQGFALGISAAGITNAHNTTAPSRRNAPVWQLSDTVNWTRGTHSLNFGANFSQINFWSVDSLIVPSITFGINTADPANAMFSGDLRERNFPGASDTDITNARNLFAVLMGHVTAMSASARLSEENSKYTYLGDLVQRARQREFGLFVQDSWRARPNLTLTGGLRWEVQFPFIAQNDVYSQVSFDDLFGVSGPGNLFKPGTLTGRPSQYTQYTNGVGAYNTQWGNLAPSIGFAWTPDFGKGVASKIFGESGKTVIRGGYSIAYNREGLNSFTSIFASNPGGTIDASRNLSLGNLGALPVLLRDGSRLTPPPFQSAPVYPNTGLVTDSVNAFNPNLTLGYVQSWTLGIQRELDRNTVLEVRYVGNRGVKLWQQYNLNETNVIENGFANEFKLAQGNLLANIAAGRGNQFRYAGPGTGTSPLPTILKHFNPTGDPNSAAAYSSTQFTSATFVNALAVQAPTPIGFANSLIADATFRNNAALAGLAANFFRVNPGKLGGAFSIENNGRSYYDAAVVEVRRRLSKGLLVQGSYTFSRVLTNFPISRGDLVYQPRSLRHLNADKALSPFGITHGFKANWIWELPFGRGKAFGADVNGVVNQVIGGWEFHGAARVQSGSPFDFGNVNLVGITRNELQKEVKMRFDDAGKIAYFLPQDIITNTIRANNVSATSATGFSNQGVPTGRYIRPASNASCTETYAGQCGTNHLVLYGPSFARYDLSIVKRFRITERVDFEFRAEFLNAFNNINFLVGAPGNDTNTIGGFSSATFGQVTSAYQDTSTTNDAGGRMIQFVARINF